MSKLIETINFIKIFFNSDNLFSYMSNKERIDNFITDLDNQLDLIDGINSILISKGNTTSLLKEDTANEEIILYLIEINKEFYNSFIQERNRDKLITPTLFDNIENTTNILNYYKFLVHKQDIMDHLQECSEKRNQTLLDHFKNMFSKPEEDDSVQYKIDENEIFTMDIIDSLGNLSNDDIKKSLIIWAKLLITKSKYLYNKVYTNNNPLQLNGITFSPFITDKEDEIISRGITVSNTSGELLFKIMVELGKYILENLNDYLEIENEDFEDWVNNYCYNTDKYNNTIICQYIKENSLAKMLAKSRLTTLDDMQICPSYGLSQILLGLIYDESYGIKEYLDILQGLHYESNKSWIKWGLDTFFSISYVTNYSKFAAKFVITLLKRLAKGKMGLEELDIQLSLLDTVLLEKILGINIKDRILEQIFYYLRDFGLNVMDSQLYDNQKENDCGEYKDRWEECPINQMDGGSNIKTKIDDIKEVCKNTRLDDTLLCQSIRGNKIARKLLLGKLTDNTDKWKPCPNKGLSSIFLNLIYCKESPLNSKSNSIIKSLDKLGIIDLIKSILLSLAKGKFNLETLNDRLDSLSFKKTLSFIGQEKFHSSIKMFILNNYVFYYLRDFGLTSLDEQVNIPKYDYKTYCGLVDKGYIETDCLSDDKDQWRRCSINQVESINNRIMDQHLNNLKELNDTITKLK